MLRWRRARLWAVAGLAVVASGAVVLVPGTAQATACGTAIPVGSNCTLTGTLTLSGGSLTLTSPSALLWTGAVTGLDQQITDTTASHQQYTVNDATGTGVGWHVTLSATTFTNGSHTLPNATTLVTTGSTTTISATTAPTATCTNTCTLPTDSTTYPVAVTTAASSPTPVIIYDTAASTGLGQVVIGGNLATNPVGWWVNVPANAYQGSYTSTLTLAIVSAP